MLARIRKAMENRDEGFTLIELLVVVIIIGILAAIAIPVFLNQRKKAVDASIKSDLKTVADAEETYAVDNQTTPYTNTKADLTGLKLSSGNVISVRLDGTNGYCIQGYNTNAQANATTKAYYYDSETGGLAQSTTALPMPGAVPTTGACAASGTFAAVS